MKYWDMMATSACFAGDADVDGGWNRIVNIDISARDDCSSGWYKAIHSGVSFCWVVSIAWDPSSSTVME